MTTSRLFLTTAAVLMMNTGPSMADQRIPLNHIESAKRICPSEWDAYVQQSPDAWADLPSWIRGTNALWIMVNAFDKNPEVVPASNVDAFLKVFLSFSLAIPDFMGQFILITSNPKHQNPAGIARARVQYDLMTCLIPTEGELDLVIEMLDEMTRIYSDDTDVRPLENFDWFYCPGGFQDISEQIFDLDPSSPTLSSEIEAIAMTQNFCY